jgi:hypothetical protein
MSNGYPRYDIFDPLAEERSRVPLHLRKDTDPVVFWLRQLLDPASRSPVYRAKPLTVLCQEGRSWPECTLKGSGGARGC